MRGKIRGKMPKSIEVYKDHTAMEPLLPTSGKEELALLSCQIIHESGRLSGAVPARQTREKIAALVREMNSYYSNLIEGHKTLPKDIERALRDDFSSLPEKKNNQLLSVAHLQVQDLMEERLRREASDVHSAAFICWMHREFYKRLPPALHWAKTKAGKKYKIKPGEMRDFMVDVGRHVPPSHEALPEFMRRFDEFYGSAKILETNQLVAIAAAHHRLAWIHPFGDGNGRVIRLHSQALLLKHQWDGNGLWTLSRGLARHRAKYYAGLEGADRRRDHDYDGRGNLSDNGLASFCKFFLETMLDQIRFMSGLLELPTLATRIDHYFQFEGLHIRSHREELARLVKELVREGEMTRAYAQQVTCRKETVTREIIKMGLQERLLESPSAKGKLVVAFPENVREFYFPRLFLDLPVEEEVR